MRKLIVMITIIAGIWYWQKHNSTGAPVLDESGNPAVVVFTVNECEPCQATLDMLTSRGVPFQKKEIDPGNEQDAEERTRCRRQAMEKRGQQYVSFDTFRQFQGEGLVQMGIDWPVG